MEYYSKIINMRLLKNHINNDPIIDWFEMQNIKNSVYEKDKNNYFKNYILKETIRYKKNFIDNFKKEIKVLYPNKIIYENIGINETIHLIKQNYPIIIKPLLLNEKYNIYVSCDIIITKDLFLKIFKDIKNISLKSIKNTEYLIINIIPEIVTFKCNLKTLIKNDVILFYQCCLYVFNSALKQFFKRRNIGFIFAKGYKYKTEILEKKNNIGFVIFDDYIKNKVINAIKWLRNLKNNNYVMDYNNVPCIELYPNMNYKNTEYEGEKKKIAEKIKEITLIWNISYNDRCELVKKNVKTWDNIYLITNLYDLKDTNTKYIQEKIIHMNIQDDIIIQPRKNISDKFLSAIKPSDNEYILDIESLIHLEEKKNYFNDLIINDLATICIIGSILLINNNYDNFHDFTINDLSIEEEKNIILNWLESLKPCTDGYVKIYHWGHAEKTYINNMKKKFPDINFPNIILIDLLHFFRDEPIIIKGCFNFGLKGIGKALYKHKLIKTTWTDTDNGLDAMIKFKEICEKKDKNIPLKRYTEIKEIIHYNQVDCLVLMEILQFLRSKYL